MKGDGLAILESGMSLGGGCLQHYGINSNTSATGFMKCVYKKKVSIPNHLQIYFRKEQRTHRPRTPRNQISAVFLSHRQSHQLKVQQRERIRARRKSPRSPLGTLTIRTRGRSQGNLRVRSLWLKILRERTTLMNRSRPVTTALLILNGWGLIASRIFTW